MFSERLKHQFNEHLLQRLSYLFLKFWQWLLQFRYCVNLKSFQASSPLILMDQGHNENQTQGKNAMYEQMLTDMTTLCSTKWAYSFTLYFKSELKLDHFIISNVSWCLEMKTEAPWNNKIENNASWAKCEMLNFSNVTLKFKHWAYR